MGEKLVVYLLSRHVQEELGQRTLDPLLNFLLLLFKPDFFERPKMYDEIHIKYIV